MAGITTRIKETGVEDGTIVTVRVLQAFCLQPYETFKISDGGVTSAFMRFTTASAAIQYHDVLVRRLHAERL